MSADGPHRLLRVSGSAVLLVFLALVFINPRTPAVANTPGFRDPVLAFELASRPEHVFGILGRPGSFQRGETVARMRLGLWLDFPFLLAYPTFTAGIALLLAARGAPRWLVRVTVGLAVGMAVGDALENRELFVLAGAVDAADMLGPLARLRIFTLVKWYALYASAGLLAIFVWRERGWWRWSAPLFALAALLGLVSLAHLPAIEWGMAPLGLAWVLTYARAFGRPASVA